MALFIPGMLCALCGQPMVAAADVLILSPFVANRADPLFVFSDAAIHKACFARHPLAREAQRWHDEAARQRMPNERVCAVCGIVIEDPDDYFGTGLLSRDVNSPVARYNFVHLHRSHAEKWSGLHKLREWMDAAQASGAWRGPTLLFDSPPTNAVRWIGPKALGGLSRKDSS